MAIEKIKILGAVLSYQLESRANPVHYLKNGPNGLNWQCYLAGSSKTAPKDLNFFQLPWVPNIILAEIHCYLNALKS